MLIFATIEKHATLNDPMIRLLQWFPRGFRQLFILFQTFLQGF